MTNRSKRIKSLLRECLAEAYERELHRELTKLDQSFAEWRDGKISSRELSRRIHQFDIGSLRELFKHYNYGEADLSVAYAIVVGILGEDEVPPELLEALGRQLDFLQKLKEQGELRMRD